jgi:hypothetical protein
MHELCAHCEAAKGPIQIGRVVSIGRPDDNVFSSNIEKHTNRSYERPARTRTLSNTEALDREDQLQCSKIIYTDVAIPQAGHHLDIQGVLGILSVYILHLMAYIPKLNGSVVLQTKERRYRHTVVEEWVSCLMTTAPRLFDETREAQEMLIPALARYELLPSITEVEPILAAESSHVDDRSIPPHPATPSHNGGSSDPQQKTRPESSRINIADAMSFD